MSDLYVEINGDGPDLVLLHGWGLNLRVWDGLVDELRDRFRVIAVDLPGHGRSPWNLRLGTPAEQAWQIHTTLAPITNHYSLLGWSLGAQIALDLTAAMPTQIERLVLAAATPRFAESADWPHGMKAPVLAAMATQLRKDYRRTVADFLELQVRGSVDGNAVLDQLRRALLTHGEARLEALEAGLRTLADGDLRPTLEHVRTPALVIAGQYDRITLPAASSALAQALPNAQFVEIRRAAHAPFLSHRAEFAALISDFLLGPQAAARETELTRPPAERTQPPTQTEAAEPVTKPAGKKRSKGSTRRPRKKVRKSSARAKTSAQRARAKASGSSARKGAAAPHAKKPSAKARRKRRKKLKRSSR
jgi:pimeloyl-[acyl-carrier protein] methyl ester esterase